LVSEFTQSKFHFDASMTFRLNNKWPGAPARFDFATLPVELHAAEGILPLPLALDDSIGTEMALILFDRTEFIHSLAATEPFDLMMKAGLVRTGYGPLMFLLFWIPNPDDTGQPLTAIDCHINPLDRESTQPWRDLSRQSHWHFFLVDREQQQQGFYEFENVYGLGDTLDRVIKACDGMDSLDFMLAKQEFCNTYDIPRLMRS
jgi:hypothetical protein